MIEIRKKLSFSPGHAGEKWYFSVQVWEKMTFPNFHSRKYRHSILVNRARCGVNEWRRRAWLMESVIDERNEYVEGGARCVLMLDKAN